MLSHFIGRQRELAKKIIKEANTLLNQITTANSYDREFVLTRSQEYLKNDKWQVRNIGVKLLGIVGGKNHLRLLSERLCDQSEAGFVRRNAAVAIRNIGAAQDDARKALISSISDRYWEIRVESVKALAGLYKNDEEILSVIIAAYCGKKYDGDSPYIRKLTGRRRENNFEVKEAIAQAMGNFPECGDSLKTINLLLKDDCWIVRAAALKSLKKIGKIPDSIKNIISNIDLTCESFTPVFPLKEIYSDIINDK